MFEIFLLFFQKNLSGVSNFLENSGKYKMHKTYTLNIYIIYFFAKSSLLTYRFAISAVGSGGDFPIVAAIFLGHFPSEQSFYLTLHILKFVFSESWQSSLGHKDSPFH